MLDLAPGSQKLLSSKHDPILGKSQEVTWKRSALKKNRRVIHAKHNDGVASLAGTSGIDVNMDDGMVVGVHVRRQASEAAKTARHFYFTATLATCRIHVLNGRSSLRAAFSQASFSAFETRRRSTVSRVSRTIFFMVET